MKNVFISGKKEAGKDTVANIIQYLHYKQRVSPKDSPISFRQFQNNLLYYSGYQIKKFATPVKQIASIVTGIPIEDFENPEFKKRTLSEHTGQDWSKWYIHHDGKMPYSSVAWEQYYSTKVEAIKNYNPQVDTYPEKVEITLRKLLQLIGTDMFRDMIHPDVWCKTMFKDFIPKDSSWLITDGRFENEIEYSKDRGFISLRVQKPCKKCGALDTHKMSCYTKEHWSEKDLDGYKSFDEIIVNDGTIDELIEKVTKFVEKFNII